MNETAPTVLWVPGQGMNLDHEYPTPAPDELNDQWQSYLQDRESTIVSAPGVFGTVRKPKTIPNIFLSVDICEVVRQTHASLRTIEEPFGSPIDDINDYCAGMKTIGDIRPNFPEKAERTRRYQDIKSIAQVMIHHGHIKPVEGIHEIAELMRSWRRLGVYAVANTSTLEGCEPGTIDFFRTYLPGAFDGIVFPRNFDGNGHITKGIAAKNIIEAFGDPGKRITAIHVDDLGHHLDAFHATLRPVANVAVKTFQPLYDSTEPHTRSSHADSPLETFRQLHSYIDKTLR